MGRWSSAFGEPTREKTVLEPCRRELWTGHIYAQNKVCGSRVSLCVQTRNITTEPGGWYTLPTLTEEDVVDNICGDTIHFSETSLPVHERSPPIGPPVGHVLTRGWATLQSGIRRGDMRRWLSAPCSPKPGLCSTVGLGQCVLVSRPNYWPEHSVGEEAHLEADARLTHEAQGKWQRIPKSSYHILIIKSCINNLK